MDAIQEESSVFQHVDAGIGLALDREHALDVGRSHRLDDETGRMTRHHQMPWAWTFSTGDCSLFRADK